MAIEEKTPLLYGTVPKHFWVARDMDGRAHIFPERPERNCGLWCGFALSAVPSSSFPSLAWDDEPMEVELLLKPVNKQSML